MKFLRWLREKWVCYRLAKAWGVRPEFVRALRSSPPMWPVVYVPRKNVVIMDLKGEQ